MAGTPCKQEQKGSPGVNDFFFEIHWNWEGVFFLLKKEIFVLENSTCSYWLRVN